MCKFQQIHFNRKSHWNSSSEKNLSIKYSDNIIGLTRTINPLHPFVYTFCFIKTISFLSHKKFIFYDSGFDDGKRLLYKNDKLVLSKTFYSYCWCHRNCWSFLTLFSDNSFLFFTHFLHFVFVISWHKKEWDGKKNEIYFTH